MCEMARCFTSAAQSTPSGTCMGVEEVWGYVSIISAVQTLRYCIHVRSPVHAVVDLYGSTFPCVSAERFEDLCAQLPRHADCVTQAMRQALLY